MVDETQQAPQQDSNLSDEEAILRIAQAMKDSPTNQEDRQNVHTFLTNVIQTEDIDKVIKIGNLRDDKEINELGVPQWNVRGALAMARISDMLMGNEFFTEYFNRQAKETTASSLSREGFIIKTAVTQNRQVADATRRRKINKGMFRSTTEESGGDMNAPQQGAN